MDIVDESGELSPRMPVPVESGVSRRGESDESEVIGVRKSGYNATAMPRVVKERNVRERGIDHWTRLKSQSLKQADHLWEFRPTLLFWNSEVSSPFDRK